MYTKKCLQCGKAFVTTKTGIFCSDLCGAQYRRRRRANERIISAAIVAIRDELKEHRRGQAVLNVYDLLALHDTSAALLSAIEERTEKNRKRIRR